MFSNVSPRWRTRLRLLVVAWALVLVAAAFFSSRSTVSEQIDAARAATDLGEFLGSAAADIPDSAVIAVGPLRIESCDVNPVRPGASLSQTLQFTGATVADLDTLADRLDLRPAPDTSVAIWNGSTSDYLNVRVTATTPDPAGGLHTDPVELQVTTGCRPGPEPAAFTPAPPEGADESWQYGALTCPNGTVLASWTEPVESEPFTVHETTGRCG
ncbi:hypothetical protein [Glycomyces buryatensis]|uniref:Uncharacterized protein n=1 Tax=Glycomyces buryatensis TaxID=2570927 RepID=A0A4S8QAF1_9ACTN|nr:hypothetical protein [Glycomyces buryatensis]THV41463.1 hypothetical protein FAB82_11735 [Glycomyces buryatensis]